MTAPGAPAADGAAPGDPANTGPLSLRAAAAEGRLRLDGLSRSARWPALAALALVVLASLAILSAALGVPLPGGVLLLPGTLVGAAAPVPVSNLAVAGFLLGLAPASVALVASALVVPRRSTRVVVLAVSGVNLSLAASGLAQLPLASVVVEVDPLAPWVLGAGCGTAVAASLLLGLGGLVPPRTMAARPRGRLVTVLAAVPGLALAATYLAGLAGGATIPTPRPAGLEAFPDVLQVAAAAVAAPLYGALARILPLLLAPVVLWEAATWARASRAELAAPVVRRVDRAPWLLVALVTAKVGWLVLGYLGWLPASLGGAAPAWAVSSGRGAVAWLVAAAFAAGAAAWLASRRSPRVQARAIEPGVRFVVGGFTAGSVVGGACVVLAGILLLLPVTGPFDATIRLGGLAADLIQPLQVATVPAALLAGLVLLRRGHATTGGFLALAGAWMTPRALFVIASSTGIVPADAANPLGVDLVTLDTLITVAVAVLAMVAASGRLAGADAGSLALVLAVSTLLAHGGTLVPPGLAPVLVLVAVLFPPFRELLFGSADLNEPSRVRPARVLGSLGRQAAALLVVAGTRTIVGGTGEAGMEPLGQLLFGPPYAAMLVAAVVTTRRLRPAGDLAGPAAGGRARPGVGLAAGLAGLAMAVAVAGLVVDPLVGRAWEAVPTPGPSSAPGSGPGSTPAPAPGSPVPGSAAPSASGAAPSAPGSPAATGAALLKAVVPGINDRMTALQGIVTERIGTASGDALATAGDELAAAAAADLAWLMAQPVSPCFTPYRDAVARHMTAYRDFGSAVAAVGRGAGDDAEISRLVEEVGASLDLVVETLGAAIPACGVTIASPAPSG